MGWGSTNNMTCYPKWTHKHRSLSKMSMISEHKCRHTLKRSIRKEKLWQASQTSLDPFGLGDDRDQRMWWLDRGPGRTDIFRAAEEEPTQPHQAKQTESKCEWVIKCTWGCASQNEVCTFSKEEFPGLQQHLPNGKINTLSFPIEKLTLWLLLKVNKQNLLLVMVCSIFLFHFYIPLTLITLFLACF